MVGGLSYDESKNLLREKIIEQKNVLESKINGTKMRHSQTCTFMCITVFNCMNTSLYVCPRMYLCACIHVCV